MKHGSLKGGMDRWIHHLEEECREAVAEMRLLSRPRGDKPHLITELAQVAQLAETMIMMLIDNREYEGEDTWQAKSSSYRADSGDQKPKV